MRWKARFLYGFCVFTVILTGSSHARDQDVISIFALQPRCLALVEPTKADHWIQHRAIQHDYPACSNCKWGVALLKVANYRFPDDLWSGPAKKGVWKHSYR